MVAVPEGLPLAVTLTYAFYLMFIKYCILNNPNSSSFGDFLNLKIINVINHVLKTLSMFNYGKSLNFLKRKRKRKHKIEIYFNCLPRLAYSMAKMMDDRALVSHFQHLPLKKRKIK